MTTSKSCLPAIVVFSQSHSNNFMDEERTYTEAQKKWGCVLMQLELSQWTAEIFRFFNNICFLWWRSSYRLFFSEHQRNAGPDLGKIHLNGSTAKKNAKFHGNPNKLFTPYLSKGCELNHPETFPTFQLSPTHQHILDLSCPLSTYSMYTTYPVAVVPRRWARTAYKSRGCTALEFYLPLRFLPLHFTPT